MQHLRSDPRWHDDNHSSSSHDSRLTSPSVEGSFGYPANTEYPDACYIPPNDEVMDPLDFSQFLDFDVLDSTSYPTEGQFASPQSLFSSPTGDSREASFFRHNANVKMEPELSESILSETPDYPSSNSTLMAPRHPSQYGFAPEEFTMQQQQQQQRPEEEEDDNDDDDEEADYAKPEPFSPSPCSTSTAPSYCQPSVSNARLSRQGSRHAKQQPPPPTPPKSKSKSKPTRPRNRKASSDSEAVARAKQAHSVVERRYRDNLNAKIAQLARALAAAETRERRRTSTSTSTSASHTGAAAGSLSPIQFGGSVDVDMELESEGGRVSAALREGKAKKSDVMGEALEYVHRTQTEMWRLREEAATLRARVRELERLLGWQRCMNVQDLNATVMQPLCGQPTFRY